MIFGKKKYELHLDDFGFKSAKKKYAAGKKVTVYYDLIATDTDYRFYSDDVELKQGYESGQGYVFTFTMPEHDVTIHVESRNTMVYEG